MEAGFERPGERWNMSGAGPVNQPAGEGGAGTGQPWSDEDDLLHYVSGSRIHLVGCGDIGGGYVSAINKGDGEAPEGVIAYTFRMDPSIEEEYREIRRRRARGEVTSAGLGAGGRAGLGSFGGRGSRGGLVLAGGLWVRGLGSETGLISHVSTMRARASCRTCACEMGSSPASY